jgi:Sulfotransferase family
VCSLAAQASAGWSTVFTGEVIGRDQLELWARGLERFMAVRARHDPAQFHDVSYNEFVKHPIQTVAAIYAYFGLTLSAAARDAMRALHTQGAPAPARPAHRYALSGFGLTGGQIDERFGPR